MRRISKKELIKKRIVAFIFFAVLLLISLFIIFLPNIMVTPAYDELFETEAVVSKVDRVHQYRGGYTYYLFTNNKNYILTGDFDYKILKDILTEGTEITIKFEKHPLIIFPDFAHEVVVNNQITVAYNGSQLPRGIFVLLGIIIFLIATAYLAGSLWWTKHLQNLQEKRDKRIQRKYGTHLKY